ncbi:6-phosphogluconolactonase [Candidatus Saccharibacteria bacterium]|nr:6-phosphogluconolactonase [Candidatus Saccharibacteria bacterium]
MDYVCTDQPTELAAEYVAGVLKKHLEKGEKVLWLLTGGSGLPIAVSVSKKMTGINTSKLFVTLTDERFGVVGHKDENWQQLIDQGFSLPTATTYRPLINSDMGTTATEFGAWLDDRFNEVDFIIGLFGIGPDGHTAGIKPHSPATNPVNTAVAYHSEDFDRVTMSFSAIRQIDEAVLQASGDDKQAVMRSLIYDDIPLNDQPAQILKEIPKLTVYSNNEKEFLP